MLSFLHGAADSVTASDPNKHSAPLLALQTRQQIASSVLSLTQNANTSVLRLFNFKS